eukprot:TRINITY_DN9096_c0_g1_i6.p1 TRINITY_DN9096_c0_g1~~TRINITY_DN9096_c0_g1_i6.p1  ORF type:complete len:341 (-),score=20.05 TRINITY_DN9096_c0_g1_i6:118-1140(-)
MQFKIIFVSFNGMQRTQPLLYNNIDWRNVRILFSQKSIGKLYKVQIQTGDKRGSSLKDVNSGVLLGLVSEDCQLVLQRIKPVYDLEDYTNQSDEILQFLRLDQQQNRQTKTRFLQGQTDFECFEAPQLGDIAGILIGPESGSWYLQEIEIQYDDKVLRFICNKLLGEGGDCSAEYLPALGPDVVMVGQGTSASYITKEEAVQMQAQNMAHYTRYTQDSLKLLAIIITLGTAVLGLNDQYDSAKAFAVGGILGGLQQLQLQKKIDAQLSDSQSQNRWIGFLSKFVAIVLIGSVFIGTSLMQIFNIEQPILQDQNTYKVFLAGFIGFAMYKVCLVILAVKQK